MQFLFLKRNFKRILPLKTRIFLSKWNSNVRIIQFRIILFFQSNNWGALKLLANLFASGRYKSFKVDCIENYSKTQFIEAKYIYKNSKTLSYSVPIFSYEKLKYSGLINKNGYTNYAAILGEATVIGGSSVILLNSQRLLYDLKFIDTKQRFKYTDGAIKYYRDNYFLIEAKEIEISFDEAISLVGNFSWNYYHLLFEILVKYEQIDELILDTNIPILVDKVCMEIPQYVELFSMLNKKHRKLIALENGTRCFVKKLYYFSCPNIIPPNFINDKDVNAEDVLFDLETIHYLRLNLLPYLAKKKFPKRIFLSRSKASDRRQFNEDEVYDVLERYGFTKVYPEDYSIGNQIAMFNNAEFIAGGSGAAFTNLLFCNQSCKVIIFSKCKIPYSTFSTITSYIGIKMLCFTEDSRIIDDLKSIHDSFQINTDGLNKIITDWIRH